MNDRDPQDPFGAIPIAGNDQASGEQPAERRPLPPEQPEPSPENGPETGPEPETAARSRKAACRRRKSGTGSWLPWLVGVPAFGLLFYVLAGYLLVPYLLGTVLPSRLASRLERPVTVGSAEFDPWSLTLTLQNGIVGPKSTDPQDTVDPLFSFTRLEMDLSATSLLRLGLICDRLTVDRPFVHLVRQADGSYNVLQVLSAETRPGGRFSLNNVQLADGRLLFDDLPAGKNHVVEEIRLALPTISNFDYQADRYLHPRFSARINGSPIEMTGETKVGTDSLEARLAMHLKEFAFADFVAYLPVRFNFKVTKGRADLNLNLIVATGTGEDTRLQVEGAGVFTDIWLHDAGGKELAALPSARATISFAPLTGSYRIKELVLQQPEVLVERSPESSLIFPWRQPAPQAGQPPGSGTLAIDKLRVENGKLSFVDRRIKGGFAENWSQIHLSIEHLASEQDQPASFALSGRNSKSAGLTAQGRLFSGPLRAEGFLVVDQLGLPGLAAYLGLGHDLRLTEGTIAKLEGYFNWHQGPGRDQAGLRLEKAALQLENLVLAREDEEWLRLEHAALGGLSLTLPGREVRIGEAEASRPLVLCRWDRQGSFNWQPAPEGTTAGLSSWQVTVDSLRIREGTLAYQDFRLQEPWQVKLSKTDLQATGLTTWKGQEGRIEGTAVPAAGGSLHFSGTLGLSPFRALLDCRLADVPVTSLRPLLAAHLAPLPTGGSLRFTGTMRLPRPALDGELLLSDLQLSWPRNQELFSCSRARSPRLALSFSPFSLQADLLSLEQPAMTWNLAAAEPLPPILAEPAGQDTLSLGKLEIQKGQLKIIDPAAAPPYEAVVTSLSGTLAPVSSQPGHHTGLHLQGRLAQGGPVSLTGTADLLHRSSAAALRVRVEELPLATLSPYLIPHLGYTLEEGLLTLEAEVRQDGRQLTADNTALVRDLRLGDKISRSSPLPLTMALLSDREGRISLDLPVQGITEDTQFSYRNAMTRGLRGYLLKTTVSPFLLLPRPFGDQVPEYLVLPPGQAELSEEARQVLETLADNLRQRPAVTASFTGFAAAEADRDALLADRKRAFLREQLAREAKLSNKLTAAYGREEISTQTLPPDASRQLQALRVTSDELLDLARRRAQEARRFLMDQGIDPKRLLLDQSAELVPEASIGRPGNRIDIRLGTTLS